MSVQGARKRRPCRQTPGECAVLQLGRGPYLGPTVQPSMWWRAVAGAGCRAGGVVGPPVWPAFPLMSPVVSVGRVNRPEFSGGSISPT